MSVLEPKPGILFLARWMTRYLEKSLPSLHLSMLDDDRLIDIEIQSQETSRKLYFTGVSKSWSWHLWSRLRAMHLWRKVDWCYNLDSEHIGKLNQVSFTKSQNLEAQTFSIDELGKIKPTPQKSCFPQLQMVETARSLISKLVKEKLQRERKTSKILKKSRKKKWY